MDYTNLSDLQTLRTTAMMHANGRDMAKLSLFDPEGRSVADPYYGEMSKILSKCTPIFSKLPIGISRYGSRSSRFTGCGLTYQTCYRHMQPMPIN